MSKLLLELLLNTSSTSSDNSRYISCKRDGRDPALKPAKDIFEWDFVYIDIPTYMSLYRYIQPLNSA